MESRKDAAVPSLTPTHTLIVPDSLSAALDKTTFSIMDLRASTTATGTGFLLLKFEGQIKNLMRPHHQKHDRFLTSVL